MANKRAPKKGRPFAAIGDRLERFRNTLHVNQSGMSELADQSESNFSQFQSGSRRISLNKAIELCQAYPGLSLDWIYFGRTDGISPEYRKKLG
jgi:hypothetical protein